MLVHVRRRTDLHVEDDKSARRLCQLSRFPSRPLIRLSGVVSCPRLSLRFPKRTWLPSGRPEHGARRGLQGLCLRLRTHPRGGPSAPARAWPRPLRERRAWLAFNETRAFGSVWPVSGGAGPTCGAKSAMTAFGCTASWILDRLVRAHTDLCQASAPFPNAARHASRPPSCWVPRWTSALARKDRGVGRNAAGRASASRPCSPMWSARAPPGLAWLQGQA